MHHPEQDLVTFIIAGGITLAGILVVLVLFFFGMAIYNMGKKKKMMKDIMNTSRKNGIKETEGKWK